MILLNLSDQEFALLLAALRHWQATASAEAYPDHFSQHKPLTDAEIDALCERVNVSEDENAFEANVTDLLTKTAMGVVRQQLGYDHPTASQKAFLKISSRAARLLTDETIASFDDRVYGMMHSQMRDAVTMTLMVNAAAETSVTQRSLQLYHFSLAFTIANMDYETISDRLWPLADPESASEAEVAAAEAELQAAFDALGSRLKKESVHGTQTA